MRGEGGGGPSLIPRFMVAVAAVGCAVIEYVEEGKGEFGE